jgi:pimeloyl-ACP methyl ester carboxylesterase
MDASSMPWHREWPNCFPTASIAGLLPGVGHFLHLERPDDVNGIIAAYLAGAT